MVIILFTIYTDIFIRFYQKNEPFFIYGKNNIYFCHNLNLKLKSRPHKQNKTDAIVPNGLLRLFTLVTANGP